jgi:hypothetical protein
VLSFRSASNLTSKMCTTDVKLVHFMHKNCTWNSPQYLQNCIPREPIQKRQRKDTATPSCGHTWDKYNLYLFCGARCWHLQKSLSHRTVETRQQLLCLKNWDVQEKDVSSRSLSFLLSFCLCTILFAFILPFYFFRLFYYNFPWSQR